MKRGGSSSKNKILGKKRKSRQTGSAKAAILDCRIALIFELNLGLSTADDPAKFGEDLTKFATCRAFTSINVKGHGGHIGNGVQPHFHKWKSFPALTMTAVKFGGDPLRGGRAGAKTRYAACEPADPEFCQTLKASPLSGDA